MRRALSFVLVAPLLGIGTDHTPPAVFPGEVRRDYICMIEVRRLPINEMYTFLQMHICVDFYVVLPLMLVTMRLRTTRSVRFYQVLDDLGFNGFLELSTRREARDGIVHLTISMASMMRRTLESGTSRL